MSWRSKPKSQNPKGEKKTVDFLGIFLGIFGEVLGFFLDVDGDVDGDLWDSYADLWICYGDC